MFIQICKLTVETLIRRHALRRLVWASALCLCLNKKDARLKGINKYTDQPVGLRSLVCTLNILPCDSIRTTVYGTSFISTDVA